jgi:hypothetical protein
MFHSCQFSTLSLLLTKLTLNAPRKQDEENAVCGKKEREMHQNLGLIASVFAFSVVILSISSVFLPLLPK